MTTIASAASINPDGTAAPRPPANDTSATSTAARRETKPDGIGLPGLRPASLGASTRSFVAPIPAWRRNIANPTLAASTAEPPATMAIAPQTSPSRADGNGWIRRILATSHRDGTSLPPETDDVPARRSDVDELVEVRHEILDEPGPTIADLRPNPGDESPQRDCGNHQMAASVATDRRRWTATGSEHAFEFVFTKSGGAAEVVDDLDHSTADRHVTHELCRPGVDLVIALVLQTSTVFGRVRRKAGRCHIHSCCSERARVCQTEAATRRGQVVSGLASTEGRSPSGQSLKTSVIHRPNLPGGGPSAASTTRACSAVQHSRVRRSTSVRLARPVALIGSPMVTVTRRPSRSQLVPLMAIGTSGTFARM